MRTGLEQVDGALAAPGQAKGGDAQPPGLATAFGTYFAARLLAAVLGLAAVSVFSRLVTPEVYGIYTLVIAASYSLVEILFQWLRSGVIRFLPGATDGGTKVVSAALIGCGLLMVLIIVLAGLLVVTKVLPVPTHLVLLGTGILLAKGAFELRLAVLQSHQRPQDYAILSTGRAAGGLVIGSALALAGGGAEGILIGWLIANCLPLGSIITARGHRARMTAEVGDTLKTMAVFGLPMALVSLGGALIANGDRYVIAYLIGVDAAGAYAVPYDLAQRSLFMLVAISFLASSPAVFRAYERGEPEVGQAKLLAQMRLILLIGFPAATLLGAAAPLVSRIVLGEGFREAANELLPWISAAVLIHGINSFYASYGLTITRRTMWNAVIVFAGAGFNLALNFMLIPEMGALGAAIATLVSYGAVLAASLTVSRRWIKLPWPTMDMIKTVLICCLCAPFLAMAARHGSLPLAIFLVTIGAGALYALMVVFDAAGARSAARKMVTKSGLEPARIGLK
ncbi:MAG: lipopolysaccharide biosynthesis protein [Geminicoccaceae bacterium]